MQIDLHVHTSTLSSDSNIAPETTIDLARARGLDGVVLTEHDRIWPWATLEKLSAAADFLVLPGVEITTDLGHVLAFGLRELPPGVSSARALRQHCDDEGALMYLAHPARNGSVPVRPEELVELFDGVEGINGSDGPLQNQASARAGLSCRLPAIAGSDSHTQHEVGLAATRFPQSITAIEDLLEALRSGNYEPLAL